MSDNERTCGTCGCYELADVVSGRCHAHPPIRTKFKTPGYNDIATNYEHPIVFPTDYCRHDWVPPVPAEYTAAYIQTLSGHARNALERAGITTPGELAGFTEEDAASLKGAGPAVMAEFRGLLKVNGLSFRVAETAVQEAVE